VQVKIEWRFSNLADCLLLEYARAWKEILLANPSLPPRCRCHLSQGDGYVTPLTHPFDDDASQGVAEEDYGLVLHSLELEFTISMSLTSSEGRSAYPSVGT